MKPHARCLLVLLSVSLVGAVASARVVKQFKNSYYDGDTSELMFYDITPPAGLHQLNRVGVGTFFEMGVDFAGTPPEGTSRTLSAEVWVGPGFDLADYERLARFEATVHAVDIPNLRYDYDIVGNDVPLTFFLPPDGGNVHLWFELDGFGWEEEIDVYAARFWGTVESHVIYFYVPEPGTIGWLALAALAGMIALARAKARRRMSSAR